MGVYKLSANSVRNGRTVYGSMLAGNTTYRITGDFESIATTSVGSGGAASVEFTSIPQTYTHLQIRGIARVSNTGTVGNDNVELQFNGDTGSNYTFHYMQGQRSGNFSAGSGTSQTILLCGKPANASAAANTFGSVVADILDYRNTNKNKTIRVLTGIDDNTAGLSFYNSGVWRSTSAITSIKLDYGAQDFTQYSHFALYGIKVVP
jgi:hypothetical protein